MLEKINNINFWFGNLKECFQGIRRRSCTVKRLEKKNLSGLVPLLRIIIEPGEWNNWGLY